MGAFLLPSRTRHHGDLGGGETSTPTVPSVRHSGTMAGSEWDASLHRAMQGGGVAKGTAPGSGGGEGGKIYVLQCVCTLPGYGDIL